jgi:hypothetical protein
LTVTTRRCRPRRARERETALKLKEEGRTWEEIGELLGVSRQRAQALGAQAKRYRKSRAVSARSSRSARAPGAVCLDRLVGVRLQGARHPRVDALRDPERGRRLRRRVAAGKMKGEGVRPGIPDLMLAVVRAPWSGIFLEMKRVRGGRTSTEQAARDRGIQAAGLPRPGRRWGATRARRS